MHQRSRQSQLTDRTLLRWSWPVAALVYFFGLVAERAFKYHKAEMGEGLSFTEIVYLSSAWCSIFVTVVFASWWIVEYLRKLLAERRQQPAVQKHHNSTGFVAFWTMFVAALCLGMQSALEMNATRELLLIGIVPWIFQCIDSLRYRPTPLLPPESQ